MHVHVGLGIRVQGGTHDSVGGWVVQAELTCSQKHERGVSHMHASLPHEWVH